MLGPFSEAGRAFARYRTPGFRQPCHVCGWQPSTLVVTQPGRPTQYAVGCLRCHTYGEPCLTQAAAWWAWRAEEACVDRQMATAPLSCPCGGTVLIEDPHLPGAEFPAACKTCGHLAMEKTVEQNLRRYHARHPLRREAWRLARNGKGE